MHRSKEALKAFFFFFGFARNALRLSDSSNETTVGRLPRTQPFQRNVCAYTSSGGGWLAPSYNQVTV